MTVGREHEKALRGLAERERLLTVGRGDLGNIIGNPLETTFFLSRLIFDGTLDRFPGIKICGAHAGGYLPSYLGRTDVACDVRDNANCANKKHPREYFRQQILVDSMVFTEEGLRHLVAELGVGQVVYGTDIPYNWPVGVDLILKAPKRVDQLNRDPVRLPELLPRFLGIGLAAYSIYSLAMILVLGYYRCPMLCTMINDGLINALANLQANVGADFDVIEVSIDPTETSAAAAEKKRIYLRRYGRAGAADGWHCLVGDQESIAQIADEVGYRYAYDPTIRQYAHPSGVVVLTPVGKISRYIFGVTFNAAELRDAIAAAKEHLLAGPVGAKGESTLLNSI